MKKLRMTAMILAVLLLLTACSPSAYPNTERGKEYGYFTYPGTDFGMTEDELFEALGEKSDKLVRDDDPRLVYQLEDAYFFDKKAEVRFGFSQVDNVEPFLLSVTIYFQEEVDPFAMIERVRAFAKEQEVELDPEEDLSLSLLDKNGNPFEVDMERFNTEENNKAASVHFTLQSKNKPSVLPAEMYEKGQENYDEFGPENGTLDMIKDMGIGSLYFTWFAKRDENGRLVNTRASLSITGSIGIFEHYAALTE